MEAPSWTSHRLASKVILGPVKLTVSIKPSQGITEMRVFSYQILEKHSVNHIQKKGRKYMKRDGRWEGRKIERKDRRRGSKEGKRVRRTKRKSLHSPVIRTTGESKAGGLYTQASLGYRVSSK